MKNKKILIIAIIVVVLLILTGGAFAYFKTDLFKSNRDLFYKYIFKDIDGISFDSQYEEKVKNANALKLTGDFSANMQTNSANMVVAETLVNGLKLNYEYSQNSGTRQQQADISLNFKDKELANVKYLKDADTYGINIKDILKTYLAVENNNLKDLFSKLGATDVSEVPDKIEFPSYNTEDLIDDETKDYIIEKYKEVLQQNIPEDKFSKEKQDITINGVGMKANKYSLTLTMQEIKAIGIELLNTLEADDRTLNFVIDTVKTMTNQMQVNTEETDSETLKNNLKESIQETIDSLKEETDISNDTIKISVYANDGKTVKHEISQNENVIVSIEYSENNIKFAYKNADVEMNLTIMSQNDSNSNTITLEGNIIENGNTIPFKYVEIASGNNNIITNNYTFEVTIPELEETIIKLAINNNIELLENIEIERLTEDSCVKINDMTAEELKSVMNTLGNQIGSMFENKVEEVTGEVDTNTNTNSTENPTDNSNTQMQTQEVESFNAMFSVYEGQNIPTTSVISLVELVITNNQSGSNVISINGISDVTQLQTYLSNIKTVSGAYTVTMSKGADGKINNITIQQE